MWTIKVYVISYLLLCRLAFLQTTCQPSPEGARSLQNVTGVIGREPHSLESIKQHDFMIQGVPEAKI